MSEKLTDIEIAILDIMKERGFEKELIVGMILCCSKMDCGQEFLDYLNENENCDDQDVLNLIVEISRRA